MLAQFNAGMGGRGAIRFLMDFLRNTDLDQADVRWLGLTPAQYGMLLLTVVGLVLLQRCAPKPESEE